MNIKNNSTKYFGTNQALSSYLNEVRRYDVPTIEEEKELFMTMKNGNDVEKKKAREEIIVRNQRFVYAIAKVYAKSENDVLEYVSEGNIGLMEAIDDFDIDKGYKFITFAVWYIRRSMNYYLNNTNNMVVRTNNMKLSKKIELVKEEYFKEYGVYPSGNDLAQLIEDKFDIKIKDVSDVYDVNMASISDEYDEDYTVEDNSDFNDKTSSVNGYEEEIEDDSVKETVKKVLEVLPSDKAEMIKMLYGIGYDRQYSVDEVGEKFELYPEEVVKLSNTILKYLKQECKSYRSAV